jgi:hypothetical protein
VRLVRKTDNLQPSVSPLFKQCGILNISQPYRPPMPFKEIDLLIKICTCITLIQVNVCFRDEKVNLFLCLTCYGLRQGDVRRVGLEMRIVGGEWSGYVLAALTWGKETPVPIAQQEGWAAGHV